MSVPTRRASSASLAALTEEPSTDSPVPAAALPAVPVEPGPDPEARLGLRFPEGFGWGAATSAYQIEGAARDDGRGPSVWDTFAHTPGRVANGDTGDVAADHYTRYAEDLDLIRGLGLKSYRFSISWPRVQPDGRGTINQRGLDFYRRLVDGLLERGISPMATLYHWDTPQALQDDGGWENRDTAYRFAEYAAAVFGALGDTVPAWLTINEPKTVVQNGYIIGHHAPGIRDEPVAYRVAHHLALAHGLGVQALRATGSASRIGGALNLHPCYAADDDPATLERVRLYDGYENRLYLDPMFKGYYPEDVLADQGPSSPLAQAIRDGDLAIISQPTDILAVQYYTPIYVTTDGGTVQKWPTTEAAWQQVYPRGMYDILTRVSRDYAPASITVTENGLPCPDVIGVDGSVDDAARVSFLRDHLAEAHRAIQDGVPLESYHVWSLMDNFEWEAGYDQRWGLVYVDYPTQRRILKRSATWYRRVISDNLL